MATDMMVKVQKAKKVSKLKEKKRIGLRPGKYMMRVNFKRQGTPGFLDLLLDVRKAYRSFRYSQKDLAGLYGLSLGEVAKMVRTDPDAPMFKKNRSKVPHLHKS